MRQSLAALALTGLAVLAGPTPAPAQVTQTGTYGAWTAIEGRSDRGRRMCAIYARGRDRSFYIKYFENEANFVVQIYKSTWQVAQRTPVQVRLQLGTGYVSNPLNAAAYPRQGGSDPVVEIALRFEGSRDFWTALRGAAQGRIDFLTGNEGSWTINLDGSNAAVGAMQGCIRRMGGGGATQPFDAAPPQTQPFDAAPPRTQPFEAGPSQTQVFETGPRKGGAPAPVPPPPAATGGSSKFP
jgi:hypothetical protein